MAKKSISSKIVAFMEKNPTAKPAAIAKALGVAVHNVYNVRNKLRKTNVSVEAEPEQKDTNWKVVAFNTAEVPVTHDPVNHPAHYKVGGIETADFILAKQLDYWLGNVVKYVSRAQHKGNYLQDLEKAQWYLSRAIEMEKNK